MSVRLNAIDEEIQQLEERIARDRAAFVSALNECGHSMRETASSPKTLLVVAGLGFVAGKLMFGSGKSQARQQSAPAVQPSKLGGLLGLVASGLALMQPASGAGGIARWAAQQLWERRRQKGAAPAARRRTATASTTVPRGKPAGATPQVRMPPRRSAVEPTTTGIR